MCWASGASQTSSKCSSTTSMSGHTARSGNQGSALGSVPEARASALETRDPGNGKSTLAQIPSCPPGLAPNVEDRRWVSQRSMPRVGTDTTSGVIGSSSGTATRSASIDTSASARSERWTCSTRAEYVAGVACRSAASRPSVRAQTVGPTSRCWRSPRATTGSSESRGRPRRRSARPPGGAGAPTRSESAPESGPRCRR